MTLLRELFEKDIDRNINGVVKVEQVNDEDLLFQELSEFVVTKELAKQIVIEKGIDNIIGADYVKLYNMGCDATDVQNAFSYFRYSPRAAKYRA